MVEQILMLRSIKARFKAFLYPRKDFMCSQLSPFFITKQLLSNSLTCVSKQLSCLVLFAVFSGSLMAFELRAVNANGEPVVDAFVAIPEGTIVAPSKELAIMDQANVRFAPHVLAIDTGQSVVFPNSDNIRHHVYSFSDPKRFEIKLYQGVPKQPVLFEKPGLVALGCNIHDSMVGYIFVSPWPEYSVTGETGTINLSKAVQQVAVWHPWMSGVKEAVMVGVTDMTGNSGVITISVQPPAPVKTFKKFRRSYGDD